MKNAKNALPVPEEISRAVMTAGLIVIAGAVGACFYFGGGYARHCLPLHMLSLLGCCLVFGLVVTGLVWFRPARRERIAMQRVRAGRSRLGTVLGAVLIFPACVLLSGVVAGIAVICTNHYLDSSPVGNVATSVLDKKELHYVQALPALYFLTVIPDTGDPAPFHVRTDGQHYEAARIGDVVTLPVHRGFLGLRYIEVT